MMVNMFSIALNLGKHMSRCHMFSFARDLTLPKRLNYEIIYISPISRGFSRHCYSTSTAKQVVINSSSTADDEKRIKAIKLEYDVWMTLGHRVPSESSMTDERWSEVSQLSTNQRLKKYKFWWKREIFVIREDEKKQERQKIHQEKIALREEQKVGGLPVLSNSIHFFIRDATMNKWYSNNMYYAMVHGPHLLIDCSFDGKMTEIEMSQLCAQFKVMFGNNKVHPSPFHVIFCNLQKHSRTYDTMEKHLPDIESFPFTLTKQHYLDLFPKERLVYLSPNARQELQEYCEDDVYIVGAIVDKGTDEPLTLAKAKREGIRCAKFPLDRHLQWKSGRKSLTIDQVVSIMLDLRHHKSWTEALKHVPGRKVHRN